MICKGGIATEYLFWGIANIIVVFEMLAVIPNIIELITLVTVLIIGGTLITLNSNKSGSLSENTIPMAYIIKSFGDLGGRPL